MLDSGIEDFQQQHRLSENIGDVTQIKLAGESAEKVLAVLLESSEKKHELPSLLEKITKQGPDVYELLQTAAVEQKELADLYTKLVFQILNVDQTDTAEVKIQRIKTFRSMTNVLIALGIDPKDYLTSRIKMDMLTRDWRNPVKSGSELLYEIGDQETSVDNNKKKELRDIFLKLLEKD